MIFQLSERVRVRMIPQVQVRCVRPRKPQPSPGPARIGEQAVRPREPFSYRPALVASGNGQSVLPPSPPVIESKGTKPFSDCDKYEDQGGCQTVLHQRYEGNRGDIMRCNTCGRTFSVRRGGISFRSRLSPEMLRELIECHGKGDSIRKTSKILNLNRGTVRRYFRLLEEGTTLEPE